MPADGDITSSQRRFVVYADLKQKKVASRGFQVLMINSDEKILDGYAMPGDVKVLMGGGIYALMRPEKGEENAKPESMVDQTATEPKT